MMRLAVFLLVCLSALAEETRPPVEKLDPVGFREVLVKSGNVYISGQPGKDSFAVLKGKGVTTVINLRTSMEMDNRDSVPFDEQAVVEELEMVYVHIPLGGPETPYEPAALVRFGSAVDNADGDVLLHCASGWRASQMWAAYLIQYKGYSADEAIASAREINFGPLPVEGLLDRTITLK